MLVSSPGIAGGSGSVREVRGKGLLNAIHMAAPTEEGQADAGDVCYALVTQGVLAKPTHNDIIRLAPPLVLSETQLDEAVEKVRLGPGLCCAVPVHCLPNTPYEHVRVSFR